MVKHSRLYIPTLIKRLGSSIKVFWRKNWWNKLILVIAVLLSVLLITMYVVAQWYIRTNASKPLQLGVSFIPAYSRNLGLDPQANMDALTNIGVKHFRFVSYWNEGEVEQGKYNFDQLDWQFRKAEDANAKVILTLGLRQPRWPECHMPDWAANKPKSFWQPKLESYMAAVVERYKDSPSLSKYQLENEYFLKGFGICTDFSRDRLVSEYNLVKKLDPHHPIVVGRSNNALGFPVGQPQPDLFSISVYKRVWDAAFSHRYLEYPQPAWFYGYIAGVQLIYNHKDMILGELQAEAWPPKGQRITEATLGEQNKSLNARRLEDRFGYGKATGMREIYMWGAEYWYYRLVELNDPSLWNVAKQQFDTKQ